MRHDYCYSYIIHVHTSFEVDLYWFDFQFETKRKYSDLIVQLKIKLYRSEKSNL